MKNKYIFWLILACLSLFFTCFVTLLGIGLRLRYVDLEDQSPQRISINIIIFIAVMALSTMIFMLITAFFRTRFWTLNIVTSIFLNYTHYLMFEALKIIVYQLSMDRTSVFIITIIEFGTKGVYLFFLDDNFIYNLVCFTCFIPLYVTIFINEYEYPDNEIGFFIIIFAFLTVGVYFLERIFKFSYFGEATYKKEVERASNLVDFMKSGFVTLNLKKGNIKLNKTMKERLLPRLLEGINLPESKIKDLFDKKSEEDEKSIEAKEKNPNVKTIKEEKGKKDKKKEKESSHKNLKPISEETHINKKKDKENKENDKNKEKEEEEFTESNILKNILFTRLERVNAYDFDGELKKACDEINTKINASTTKTEKYKFFNNRKTSKLEPNDKVNDVNIAEDKSMFNKSEIPLIKEKDFKLLSDSFFNQAISILLKSGKSLFEFRYMGNKRIKQENDNDFICTIFVRYDEHGNNLEFVITETVNKQINTMNLGRSLLQNSVNHINVNEKSSVTIVKTNKADKIQNSKLNSYINKANVTIKFPLKEISLKLKEAIEMIDGSEETSIDDLRDLLIYIDNISSLTNYSLDDLKIMSNTDFKLRAIF